MEESASLRTGATSIAFQHLTRGQFGEFSKIGAGGFGIVYKAKHQTLGDVAVKQCRMYTQTEVDGMAKPGLNSCIVQLYGKILSTRTDEYSYIVMEYMQYGSLKEFSRKLKPFPDSLKIKMISEVINGMYFLHEKDITHRDLKLENIFVGKEFSVKIGDLGLATWKSVENPEQPNAAAGTMIYMAPESFTNINEPAQKLSDVYSFGITLWELSTGEVPYKHARNTQHIQLWVMEGKRPDMTCFPDVPHIIKDMMERAWKQTPNERPTFKELKEEIEKEYDANYKKDYKNDLLKVYKQPFLAQREEEEKCDAPWGMDITDSSSGLMGPEGNVSMDERPTTLRSIDQLGNGSKPEKRPVPVSDTGKGELPAVQEAMANLTLDGKAVQPESDAIKESCNPSESGSAHQPTTEEFKPRIPFQESQHTNPETPKYPSFESQQHYRQYQPGPYPQRNDPFFMQQDQWNRGYNINISGDSHTVIVGSTVTMTQPQKGEKQAGRQDNSSSSKGDGHTVGFERSTDTVHTPKEKKMGTRQEGSTESFDSESDVLDPEVQEIMNSSEILREQHIGNLSSYIGRRWKKLGLKLGMMSVQMENIESDYRGDQQEMAFQVMLAWKRKKGRATKGELARALVGVDMSEVALKLK